jgi:hypothetical protein
VAKSAHARQTSGSTQRGRRSARLLAGTGGLDKADTVAGAAAGPFSFQELRGRPGRCSGPSDPASSRAGALASKTRSGPLLLAHRAPQNCHPAASQDNVKDTNNLRSYNLRDFAELVFRTCPELRKHVVSSCAAAAAAARPRAAAPALALAGSEQGGPRYGRSAPPRQPVGARRDASTRPAFTQKLAAPPKQRPRSSRVHRGRSKTPLLRPVHLDPAASRPLPA